MKSKIRIKRICQYCEQVFTAKTTVTKYCGNQCAKRGYRLNKKQEKINASNEETKEKVLKPIIAIQGKDYLSVKDVCGLFDISRTSVWRLSKSGKVKTAKIGGKVFFLKSSIDELFRPHLPDKLNIEESDFDIEDCFYMGEIKKLYNLSTDTLASVVKRNNLPKFKKGRFAYIPKEKIFDVLGRPQNQ